MSIENPFLNNNEEELAPEEVVSEKENDSIKRANELRDLYVKRGGNLKIDESISEKKDIPFAEGRVIDYREKNLKEKEQIRRGEDN